MHYEPFTSKNFPSVTSLMERFPPKESFSGSRPADYFDGRIRISIPGAQEKTVYEFDLNQPANQWDGYPNNALHYLSESLSSLLDAEASDDRTAHTKYGTQFEVNRAFRSIQQAFGGRRYVFLCWDLIDENMGTSLHPYMYPDLISAIHATYNKNIHRDVSALLDALVDMIEGVELSSEEKEATLARIVEKSPPHHAHYFAQTCIARPGLNGAIQRLILTGLCPNRHILGQPVPHVDMFLFRLLDKDHLMMALAEMPRGQRMFILDFFAIQHANIDPDYVRAYLRNPAKDIELILNSPFYKTLPSDIKKSMAKAAPITARSKTLEVVEYFNDLTDQAEKENVIRTLRGYNRNDLASALAGQDFALMGFSAEEVLALMPNVLNGTWHMKSRLKSYLRELAKYSRPSKVIDKLFLALPTEDYADVIKLAFDRDIFFSQATYFAMAEKHGNLKSLGFKEWKYHA